MMNNNLIDPLNDLYALQGRVVTMNDPEVIESGVVYIKHGSIDAVRRSDEATPAEFEATPVIQTGGTIFPGLIELHNHLSYNVLPLWDVPELFKRRSQWRGHPDKRKLITAPMQVLGKSPGFVEAIVRYVECKCLVAGVTTSQGISLYGVYPNPYYQGIVRNVEAPTDPALKRALTKVSDVDDLEAFWQRLQDAPASFLLHLSEGVDAKARRHFEALQFPTGDWALEEGLAGIHCTALKKEDLEIMASHEASLVWSPLSNLLLYGQTTNVQAAKQAGILMSLGSDWSPTGSKNLLCELKVAHLVSQALGGVFTGRELVEMVTRNAAKILQWDQVLGTIEMGKRADLLVINSQNNDVYADLIGATEGSVELVVINGIPRYGSKRLMESFAGQTEEVTVNQQLRVLNLWEETADPRIRDLSLNNAISRLRDGFKNLVALAKDLEDENDIATGLAGLEERNFDTLEAAYQVLGISLADLLAAGTKINSEARPIFLGLDLDEGDMANNIVSPFEGASVPYSELLQSVEIDLDSLTVVDDATYVEQLVRQINLPNYIKTGLPTFYSVDIPIPEDVDFLTDDHAAVKSLFSSATTLSTFLRQDGFLTLVARQRIVEQALVLLEKIYVHLPLKRAMHAVDPIQRLKLLQFHLEHQSEETMPPEIEFHQEMTSIFTALRDLHTNYLLPYPFRGKVAFLPFFIEEYYDEGEPKYMVSKVFDNVGPSSFTQGAEIRYWNGIPIRRAIALNAERQAGGNMAARHARGLDTMTIRPLTQSLPPDEEWVTIQYCTENGQKECEFTQKWLVVSLQSSQDVASFGEEAANATVLGLDLQTDTVHQLKKALYAPLAIQAEKQVAKTDEPTAPPKGIPTHMPTVFRARSVPTPSGEFGSIRIFTFQVSDADSFVEEFIRLAGLLPQNGLIIDVRGNGGGLIWAAERLLQVLTPDRIEPERAQFINSPLTLELCNLHAPSPLWNDFTLEKWQNSISQSVRTGATYSLGFPITSPESCNAIGQRYEGPVILITDAMCYSATDIFAAGFQDHEIGPILGVADNTGAGGANVWSHTLLQSLMSEPEKPAVPLPTSPFEPLPHGAEMRVAVRRTLRVGEKAGMPVEDFGINIEPKYRYRMTKEDLLEDNVNLINRAGEILASLLENP